MGMSTGVTMMGSDGWYEWVYESRGEGCGKDGKACGRLEGGC